MTGETSASNRRRVGAYAVCVERQEILLTRLWEADIEAGRWTLPGGGMDFGEHPDQTVLRELYEETGLAGTIRRLLDVQSHVYPAWREHGPLQMVQFIYDVAAFGIPRVIEQGGSTVEAAWIPLEAVSGLGRVPLVDQALELLR